MSNLKLIDNYNNTIKPYIKDVSSVRLQDPFNSLWWKVTQETLEPFEEILKNNNFIKILDYGGGCGHKSANIASLLIKKNKSVSIDFFDLDINACNLASKLFKDLNINHKIFNFYDNFKSVEKNYYDLVILSEVYEHFPLNEVSKLTRDICEKIKSNGFLFLTTPNFYGMGRAEDSPIYYKKQKWGHYKHYKPKEVIDNLFFVGLKNIVNKYSCNKNSKIRSFSKYWYPFFRLDVRLCNSKKLPNIFKKTYYYLSYPFFFILNKLFCPLIYSIFYKNYTQVNDKNSCTMHFLFKK